MEVGWLGGGKIGRILEELKGLELFLRLILKMWSSWIYDVLENGLVEYVVLGKYYWGFFSFVYIFSVKIMFFI